MKQVRENAMDGLLALAVIVLGMLVMMIGFNYKTIRLSLKGYSPSEINMILEMAEDNQTIILSEERFEHIDWWIMRDDNASHYASFESLLEIHPHLGPDEVVARLSASGF